ncbi:ubiquinol-cytochrome c reductase cytochrome c1 subunit [Rheinheimera pacifica]|uniref:Ubiquinol-cytochrome c reductase cytochrome c1 subunit n=1 Tax=Rheinheimera pacifica TaxID=173990 RepID=A0A1H6NB07_9GAMM|nr:cytochrome c1 [Rheinheimera pacifica]SEI08844.1 ubiquinol-cytochrome c reductase cytochrome c1 subunit [Rheinheimera pacifica]
MMKNLFSVIALVASSWAMAAGPAVHLDKAPIDLTDKASLQNGARLFQNYCLGCHQMQYQRYSRTFSDLDIPEEVGMENLMFTGEKVGDHITNNMSAKDGEKWFGATPPDLTNVARVRGPDWLYTYLRSFYADPSRPFGVNNDVFPLVGMPHVLQELQGMPYKAYETRLVDGASKEVYVGIKTDGSGELNAEEYDRAVADLVNYLEYVGEPTKLEARALGTKVMVFLLIFFVLAYLLKKEYWKDVH